jgi:hypothetical protein
MTALDLRATAPLGCAPPILGADPDGVRRRQQPEAQIQRAVFQHFRARGAPGVFAFHPANGGFRRPVEAAILKGLGVRTGVPDLIACRGGRFYALELKTDTGKLSDAQEQVLAALREAGAEVAATYGLDAALAQLERWQLLRGVASCGATSNVTVYRKPRQPKKAPAQTGAKRMISRALLTR